MSENTKKTQLKRALYIKVYKNNNLYLNVKFPLNTIFAKNITIGSQEKNSLHLVDDSISIPKKIKLFRIRKNRVELYPDNRFSGKIFKDNKVRDIEFSSPIDHRKKDQKSSIKKKLETLDLSSYGDIKINNFSISFKISKDSKDFISKSKGLDFTLFHIPNYNIPFEIHSFWIALFSTLLVFFSFLYWLSKESTYNRNVGLVNLPIQVSVSIIHPDNFRFTPFVFQDNFSIKYITPLSLYWLSELNNRWLASENNEYYLSDIPILHNYYPIERNVQARKKLTENIRKMYHGLEFNKDTRSSVNNMKYLKKYPSLSARTSNRVYGSNYLVSLKRLEQLKNSDIAIKTYLIMENKALRLFYESLGAEKKGIVEPPSTKRFLGAQPSPKFYSDYKNYKEAEYYAQYSKKYGSHNIDNTNDDFRNETLFINYQNFENNIIIPHSLKKVLGFTKDTKNNNNFWENVELYKGFKSPKITHKKPEVDLSQIKLVVFSKKDEISSCYNIFLTNNPGLKGEMVWQWSINMSGQTEQIKLIRSDINNLNFINCIKNRISRWTFPKPKKGKVSIRYPFKFVPINK